MSDKLRSLNAQLHEVEANIQRLRSERLGLREAIGQERQRLQQDRARVQEALTRNVMSQWESGWSVPQIAASLGRSEASVHKVLADWRQREGVTVRRGRMMR